jgi:hypothetical protein
VFHTALFVVTMPEDRNEWVKLRQDLYSRLQGHTDAREMLGENVWLLRLSVSLAPLGQLISACEHVRIAYRLLPFDNEPLCLPAGPYQTPNPANRGAQP